jgi:predicted transposase YbfD/YdcC
MNNIKTETKNLYKLFSEISDHRRGQGKMHKLEFLLIIATMSIMSGYYSLRSMDDFVKKNGLELIRIFKPKNDRLPSFNTLSRALRKIDFDQLNNIFYQWANSYVTIEKGEWLSIDGKAIGGTVNDCSKEQQNFISLVSVFASKQKQVLQIGKINSKKESEIPKLKELIRMLDLEGMIFSMDALHCQKDTVKTIIESKNDYCIGVKGNQKKLHTQLKKTSKPKNQQTPMKQRKKVETGKKLER